MTGRFAALVAGLLACTLSIAGEPWLAPGDARVRHDVQLLVDDGIIDLPVSGWPIPVSDLANALAAAPRELSPAQAAAAARLRSLAREGRPAFGLDLRAAARPTVLRSFEATPREEGEVTGWTSGFIGERWGARVELTAVADPDDDDTIRLDGSYLAGMFGNWIVTAGAQDRWWGSSWQGSLILSNNARPVPALALDRAVSEPFESRWLSWIGPWRLSTFMGYMEGDREDVDHPLLFGMRISARPLDGLEISLERTAQWCGEGRSCSWSDFWNLWSGNDNAGENVEAEDEPGNQLAGWDIRWASPFGTANYALYNQHTGETIDNNFPRPLRSMDTVGLETWGGAALDGSSWRASLEWTSTRCGGTENGERLWDCAYNNNIFNVEGYRSKGRPLGHSMDGDGQMYSARYVRVTGSAATMTALLRYTLVNENGVEPDERHSIAPGPEDWVSVDFVYRHPLPGGWIEATAGGDYRDREWNDSDALLPRLSVAWRREFQ